MTTSDLPLAEVSHSVLHPDFIVREVARRYALKGDLTCFLLYRGMNDVYLVQDAEAKYALRVWRKTYRDVDDVSYELDFLDYLRRAGFPPRSVCRSMTASSTSRSCRPRASVRSRSTTGRRA
ncbi:hypothetical protein ACFSLT_25730 [Novosphingobium resinovorum]